MIHNHISCRCVFKANSDITIRTVKTRLKHNQNFINCEKKNKYYTSLYFTHDEESKTPKMKQNSQN